MKILYASLLIYLVVNTSGQPVTLRQGSQELFISEVVRVRRQAGYVYDKPSISFDLPTRAPSTTVTTQAPTVDRTQEQMMYYAYPAPATGSTVNIGSTSGSTASASGGATATDSTGISGGYSYEGQNAASAQFNPTTGSSQTGSELSSRTGYSGYGNNSPTSNAPVSTGSIQQPTSGNTGYGYNIPSAGGASTQTNNAGSSQSGSIIGSGYDYKTPATTRGSGTGPLEEVSTNAPKYLPPISADGGNSNNILSGPVFTGGETGPNSGGSAIVTQPLDQYLPPLISKPNPSVVPVVDQYLPPNIKADSPATITSSSPSINRDIQSGSGDGPSSSYIPPLAPNLGQSLVSIADVTPRPFSSPPLSNGYLPPNANLPGSSLNPPSTPASPYLPPVL